MSYFVFYVYILTEFEVFRLERHVCTNRDAEPRSGEALRFVRAGLFSTWAPKTRLISDFHTQRRIKFDSD